MVQSIEKSLAELLELTGQQSAEASAAQLVSLVRAYDATSGLVPTIFVAASNASPSSRLLAAPAYRCDGVADNVEIQAALNVLVASGGGRVGLSEGTFNLAGRLQFGASNLALVGQGIGITKLFLGNGENTNGIYIPVVAYDNLLIQGFELDMNGANQSDGAAPPASRDSRTGIWFDNDGGVTMRDQATLRDLWVHDTRHGEGINFQNINRGVIERVYTSLNGIHSATHSGDGLHTAFCIDMTIDGYVALLNDDTGIAQDYNQYTTIVNAICRLNASNQFTFARESKYGSFVNCIGAGGQYGFRTGKFGDAGAAVSEHLIVNGCQFQDTTVSTVLMEDHSVGKFHDCILTKDAGAIWTEAGTVLFVDKGRNLGYTTENGGARASVTDGGTIPHGLAATPTYAIVVPSIAGEMVSITAKDATNLTVAIKKHDGAAGTQQIIYWRAWI